jgi:2-polyprenyl-3-methyl-5-hydroxy-6-metoxy-1,4-benzoquinol methylase
MGEEINLEDALKIPNSVQRNTETHSSVKFHSPLINQAEVKQSEVQFRWEETSNQWLELVDKTTQDDRGDLNRQFIIDPAMWELIGDVKGLTVLDAGCGNGYFSRKLAQKGASVTGVDQSRVFIDFCKEKEKVDALGIEYYIESLEKLARFDTGSFDLIVSNIVFVDVLDFRKAFKELARLLKPSGRFIWSNLHPVFGRVSNIFYRVPSDTPRNEERLYVMIDRYFDSGGTLISWGTLKPIWQFDRTLSEYTKALKEAGFVIRQIIEPKPSNDIIMKHPRFLAFDTDRIPFFIIYECIKYES